MNIGILGAGAWGTALSISASNQPGRPHHVSLWARDAEQAANMAQARVNTRYLPDAPFGPDLTIRNDTLNQLRLLADTQDLLVLATPVAGLRSMLQAIQGTDTPVAWLCKGFEQPVSQSFGLLPHEVHSEFTRGLPGVPECAVLSGPSFAAEVARGKPSALVAASASARLRHLLVDAFHGPALRVYASVDVVGVEVGGAVKNVLAIATGLCDGLNLGLNARAALITRGLAEMTRLGMALGARAETFMGLSGLGDLVLTATGDLSRNRKVGLLLASGKTLKDAVDSLGHVAEGVYCARTVVQRARHLGVDMPIAQSVVSLLDGECTAQQVVSTLMMRDPKAENQATEAA
jgi:glycerol-3-phosphate dehydrogenase (NAD(P)+)